VAAVHHLQRDDHDVHDDWNTSWAWVREMRTVPWWHERILGAYMSYWIYQHLGNLSPIGSARASGVRAASRRHCARVESGRARRISRNRFGPAS
jgi:hypothetical protein